MIRTIPFNSETSLRIRSRENAEFPWHERKPFFDQATGSCKLFIACKLPLRQASRRACGRSGGPPASRRDRRPPARQACLRLLQTAAGRTGRCAEQGQRPGPLQRLFTACPAAASRPRPPAAAAGRKQLSRRRYSATGPHQRMRRSAAALEEAKQAAKE